MQIDCILTGTKIRWWQTDRYTVMAQIDWIVLSLLFLGLTLKRHRIFVDWICTILWAYCTFSSIIFTYCVGSFRPINNFSHICVLSKKKKKSFTHTCYMIINLFSKKKIINLLKFHTQINNEYTYIKVFRRILVINFENTEMIYLTWCVSDYLS